jgi:hypothetical protein
MEYAAILAYHSFNCTVLLIWIVKSTGQPWYLYTAEVLRVYLATDTLKGWRFNIIHNFYYCIRTFFLT